MDKNLHNELKDLKASSLIDIKKEEKKVNLEEKYFEEFQNKLKDKIVINETKSNPFKVYWRTTISIGIAAIFILFLSIKFIHNNNNNITEVNNTIEQASNEKIFEYMENDIQNIPEAALYEMYQSVAYDEKSALYENYLIENNAEEFIYY